MKKFLTSFFTFFLFIISCFILTSPSRAAVTPDTSEIRERIRFSECVRPYNGGLLIANYGSQHKMPAIHEIKGYILYRKDGQTKTLIPPGLLQYPSGMAVKDDHLFVCDGYHLRVYNLQQPEKAPQTVTFPKPYWLKAAAVDGNTLYVSSNNMGQIFTLDISHAEKMGRVQPKKWLELPGVECMAVGNGIMYITASPENGPDTEEADMENIIYRVSDLGHPQTEKFIGKKVYSGNPAADKNVSVYYEGITLSEDNHALYVADHRVKTGAILVIDIGTKEMRTIYEAEGLDPADLTLTDKALFIPDMKNHRVLRLEL